MATIVAHNWPDVIYLALLVIVAVVNILHNTKISRKADNVAVAVDDVKRATGVVKRADDPDPVIAPGPETIGQTLERIGTPPTTPKRRATDKP